MLLLLRKILLLLLLLLWWWWLCWWFLLLLSLDRLARWAQLVALLRKLLVLGVHLIHLGLRHLGLRHLGLQHLLLLLPWRAAPRRLLAEHHLLHLILQLCLELLDLLLLHADFHLNLLLLVVKIHLLVEVLRRVQVNIVVAPWLLKPAAAEAPKIRQLPAEEYWLRCGVLRGGRREWDRGGVDAVAAVATVAVWDLASASADRGPWCAKVERGAS